MKQNFYKLLVSDGNSFFFSTLYHCMMPLYLVEIPVILSRCKSCCSTFDKRSLVNVYRTAIE